MKVRTTELMKFRRLCRTLNESTRGVVGLLELLWKGAAQNTPQGDLGRFSNVDIALLVDWEHDPDALISGLVKEGWLDEHPEHRLVVHDWHDHAPSWVSMNLRKQGLDFVTRRPSEPAPDCPADTSAESPTDTSAEVSAEATPERSNEASTLPPLSSPNLTSPSPPPPPASDDAKRWERVGKKLVDLRVSKATQAVEAAQRRGLSVEEARELIREFESKPKAWEAGALFGRLTGSLEHWPPTSDAYRPPVDQRAAAERAARERELTDLQSRHDREVQALPTAARARLYREAQRREPEARAGLPQQLAVLRVFDEDPARWMNPEVMEVA
ncbi:hypothetical protein Pla123a_28880 [Posidoniimonas polymericola]|uniref:Uncharacterized protein n=1 Tax=Posidoniimonas polymericola TaxID=2528002 RepID=A0A5C5YMM6_9BACT|nr:hypothetical protein Pla123a_28880 [Posidoniimonas polymericola]